MVHAELTSHSLREERKKLLRRKDKERERKRERERERERE